MKHTQKITFILISLFLLSQIIGLAVTYSYFDLQRSDETGKQEYSALPFGIERPHIDSDQSYLYIIFGVLIGTGLALLLIRFKKPIIWKAWFFLAIWLCLGISFFGIFRLIIPSEYLSQVFAGSLATVLAVLKLYRTSPLIHNLSEMFIYSGIAAIFVPVVSIFSAIVLLILISIYDAWAVFYSKHMVKLAKAQSKMNLFAGLSIPYSRPADKPKGKTKGKASQQKNSGPKMALHTAILGGGDISFALLFSGAVLVSYGFIAGLITSIFASLGLLWLLLAGKKDKFYPAMPAITLGCMIGYGLVMLLA